MPLGDDENTAIVEESQLLHDHTRANVPPAHSTICVVGEVPAQPLTLTQKIEKQQAALAGASSSSSSATPAPFGRAFSWSSTCAVVDEISDAEDPHTPLLQQPACHRHTTSPAQHYRQSSEQPHLFYEDVDVDVLSCVGSAGSESPYRRDTFEESSVASSLGAYYHYHHNHRRNSGPPTKEMKGTRCDRVETTTSTASAAESLLSEKKDADRSVVKASGSDTTNNIEVVPEKREELPVDCDYPLTSITTTKPDSASVNNNTNTALNNASANKRVAVPVKYQGGSVPLVALMPVDPTAKYRKISKSFGTAAAFHVDFEALYRDHSAYVAALKLAAPKVRPSPFPFLHEMRMQRKRNSNKPTITTTTATATSHTHPHQAPSTQPQPHNPSSRQHHNQAGHHRQPITPTTPNSAAAYAFYTRDQAPVPRSSPSSGGTPPTYHHPPQPQQQYHSLPTYHRHAAPTSVGHPHRPSTATSFF